MHETEVNRPVLLVVDDELSILRVIGRLGAKAGFEVVTCTSSGEALRGLMQQPADLAMVDLSMPDMDGLDLRREIRRAAPGCEVILMRAGAGVDRAEEAVKPGAREYMDKPLDFDRVGEVLAEIRDGLARRLRRSSEPFALLEGPGREHAVDALQEVSGYRRRPRSGARTGSAREFLGALPGRSSPRGEARAGPRKRN